MKHYRFLDLTLASALELPELPLVAGPGQLRFEVTRGEAVAGTLLHEWCDEDGTPTLRCERIDGQEALVFPEVGTFLVGEGSITAWSCAPEATIRHCLLDQVLPRYCARGGALMLHAAAVGLDGSDAALLVGPSGAGKSTLVAHAAGSGGALLSDDCVHLCCGSGAVRCEVPYRSLRVFPDSRTAAGLDDLPSATFIDGSDKRRISGLPAVACAKARVGSIFLLGGESDRVELKHLSAMEALPALAAQLFTMNPTDLIRMREQFDGLAALLRAGVRVHELRFPREFPWLPRVWEAIRSEAAS